jgi:hypothetical protein
MTDDPDIWRAARDDAALVAARRADELLAATDFGGCEIWKRILEAVGELTRTMPVDGERVN